MSPPDLCMLSARVLPAERARAEYSLVGPPAVKLRAHGAPGALPSAPLACRVRAVLCLLRARAWAASWSCALSMPRAKAACRGVRDGTGSETLRLRAECRACQAPDA
eukprot:15456541-Alexandrium_andersonii.AAC.1